MKTSAAAPGPTPRQVGREVVAVVADVPRFVGAPLFRRRHLRWGATPAEVAGAMPGDGWVSGAQYRATRVITIDAPPEAVWPWLVQVGCLRAGFYSDDLLDNLAHPSATSVIPGLQHLRIGQWSPGMVVRQWRAASSTSLRSGVLPAERLSNATLLAVVMPWAVVVERRHPTASSQEALMAGALWGTLTVAFEFVGGRYLTGDNWRALLDAYDVTAGHLWPLAVCGVVLAPVVARMWRLARASRQSAQDGSVS